MQIYRILFLIRIGPLWPINGDVLAQIVDKLHWYVKPGDMIVDFCCGANDFSRLMKEKLDHVQKKCHFRNYDLIQPQNHSYFEKRDWMTVRLNELIPGSQLIMGLNPPFGVNAALANKFIDKALQFKPKLIVLIVPKETKRLDKKKTPYDLIWEDSELLAGKAFYLPGSVDHNDKTVEGWNASAPPLYLWSRPDWTKKHKKVAEEHNHTCIGNVACRVSEGTLSDPPVKDEAESSDRLKARSEKEDTRKMPCHPREDNLSDDLPVRKQTKAANKWNSRSGRERDTTNEATCNVREVNLPAYCRAKKRARSEDGRKTTQRIAIHEKEAVVADKVPVKKLAEATNKEVSASGNGKKHGRYENRSRKATPDLRDNLPPEKQVEVAYEETKVVSRKTIPDEQKGAVREDGRYTYQDESKNAQHNYEKRLAGSSDIKFREGGDSDMSISPRDGSNAQNKSMSYPPTIPTESFSYRAANHDNYMSHLAKEPYNHALSGAAYGNNYLESNHEYSGYRDIDDRSRNVSSFEDPGCVAPTVDPYSSQFRRPDDSLYGQISEAWNPRASERYLVADIPMPGCPTRYDGHVGSRTPIATDLHTHPRMPGGTGTDGYLQPRYSLGSSGARSSQPPITPSFVLSGASAPRGSVTDKYAYGLSGPSGPQGSIMDRYVPSVDGTNNATTKSFPQQYPK